MVARTFFSPLLRSTSRLLMPETCLRQGALTATVSFRQRAVLASQQNTEHQAAADITARELLQQALGHAELRRSLELRLC